MGINIVMIILITRDRRVSSLTDHELSLFQNLRGLTPGQFRRLMKLGRWQTLEEPLVMTREGQALDRLYYILQGEADISKADRSFKVDSGLFIGELAFLRNKPATATVTGAPGAVLVSWSHADLQRATAKDQDFSHALSLLLSADLAEKVARA
jgi:CRP-like cAMP-binding protein